MRIVQIIPALNDGGVERGTAESNREYIRCGHTSIVISSGGRWVKTIEADGGKHYTMDVKSKNPLTFLPRMLQLRRLLREINPDVVHLRSRVPAWLHLFANRPLGIPSVATLHGLHSTGFYSSVITRFDRVICVGSQGVEYLKRYYHVPEDKIDLIHPGIDATTFNPEKLDQAFMQNFVKEYYLSGKFVATAVGRITSLKGFEVLIRAVAELKESFPELVALIVGSVQQNQETYAAELKTLAETLGVTDRIHFTGSQTRVPEIYSLSNVVCSCNTHKPEAFGRTAVEALVMDRPVIAAAHGGMLDIVRDGVNGWLVPPGDSHALAEKLILAKTAQWHGLRDYALANFSMEQMTEKTLAVYRKIQKS